ncbi:cupin domain-containing protein [uncultured Winogradskyella sp.]|uniref:cupin domain-containing protein n=1 Tax=uncultured Winogradskyella sp. TaxID=395353 RepID=UPI0030ECA9B1|tara:strand:+ start:484 stop:864 length:381 start_codon:yes stop_codon:yes gene_type:complete
MTSKQLIFNLCLCLFILSVNCENKSQLPDPLQAGWDGNAVCEVVEENQELRVLKCTFEPNVGHEEHYHNPHFGYTLSGGKFRIKDNSGTREVNVPTGYSFRNDEITTHEVLNIGKTTAVFLIMEYK